MELLFESRQNIQAHVGRTHFAQHQPTVHAEPVLRPDTFADQYGASVYGTVLREGDVFRMWYQAMPGDWDLERDMAGVAYAESADGITWEKPRLNILEGPYRETNYCDLGLHCPSIFIDPEAPDSHRYRATGYASPQLFMAPIGLSAPGYYTSHSADGLNWQIDSTNPQWHSADVITSIYHPAQRRGLAAMKYCARVQRIDRRCIHTAELRGGKWSSATSALYPEEYDDIAAMSRGYQTCDYYGMGMMAAGSGTVGFLWNYWHNLPYTGNHHAALYGTSDVTLVYQPEPGGKWFHMPGHPNFIDHRSYDWMDGWIYTASCPVDVGDEQRLYFTGMPFEHGFNLNTDWKRNSRWAKHMVKHCERAIGFASWPKYRLFGIESPREGGFTIDLGVLDRPARLWLNYKSSFGGSVRVELESAAMSGGEISNPLEGNETRAPVCWSGGPEIASTAGKTLKARIHLEKSIAYAYEIEYLS